MESESIKPWKRKKVKQIADCRVFKVCESASVSPSTAKEHPFFLMQGEMSILTEDGIKHLKAPYNGITKPGTKRIIYTHTDCVFVTVHATTETDVAKIEEQVIAKDFSDPLITQEDLKLLKNKKI